MATSVVKSVRMNAELWAWLEKRAALKEVSPNGWLVLCVEAARKRVENGKDAE